MNTTLTDEKIRQLSSNAEDGFVVYADVIKTCDELLRLRAEHSACYSIGESLGKQMREVKDGRDRLRAGLDRMKALRAGYREDSDYPAMYALDEALKGFEL